MFSSLETHLFILFDLFLTGSCNGVFYMGVCVEKGLYNRRSTPVFLGCVLQAGCCTLFIMPVVPGLFAGEQSES